MCECYQIGGPWIAEDPSCPVHGVQSRGRAARIEAIIEQAVSGEITPDQAASYIEEEWY